MTDQNATLVLGATGKTGRRVVQRLQLRGVPVRVGFRSSERPFDWNDRSTWNRALDGAGQAYVAFSPDLAVPGAAETIRAFADAAVESGLRRLVLLSGRGEPEAQRCESIIQNSGAEWTIVRSSWFNQNFSESFMVEQVASGRLALPAGNVGEPFIDVDDIADVAVAALTEPGHVGELYEITGSRLLTFAEAVAEIGAAAGRRIQYEQVSVQDYASALAAEGLPRELVALLTYLFGEVLDGRNAYVADGVERALGRPPRDFRAFARKTAASGIWDQRREAIASVSA